MSKKKRRSSHATRAQPVAVFPRGGELVRLAGAPVRFEVEQHDDPKRIDHVWLHLKAGVTGVYRVSLNTWSLMSFKLGYDPRICVAIVHSRWSDLPPLGIFPSNGLDYTKIPINGSNAFRAYDRVELERLIGSSFKRAALVEAWGELYSRGHRGLHQVHSRRGSAAIATDHVGRDGAVRFYYQDMVAELFLFKFFGQP